jgi:hypothetical protein
MRKLDSGEREEHIETLTEDDTYNIQISNCKGHSSREWRKLYTDDIHSLYSLHIIIIIIIIIIVVVVVQW